jgi:ribonuclease HI
MAGIPNSHRIYSSLEGKNRAVIVIENWYIQFTWIKAHAGHSGSELADKLAKEAAKNNEICYNKISKCEIVRQESEKNHNNMATTLGHHHQRTGN